MRVTMSAVLDGQKLVVKVEGADGAALHQIVTSVKSIVCGWATVTSWDVKEEK